MQLTNQIKSIAIGSFDGIHLGHKALIDQAEAVVVIERNGGYLTPGYKRVFEVDKPIFFYHFEKIRSLLAHEFVVKLNEDFPKLDSIVVGYDFEFGFKKEGDTKRLQELFNGEVIVVDEVKIEGISVHSRTIKGYLHQGEIGRVNLLLGRAYRVEGRVIKGQGLGTKALVPTLNLNIYDYQLPKDGVYATRTKVGTEWLPSVSFIGLRVTTDGSFAVETHILSRDVEVTQGRVGLEFVAFIRENKKFDSLESLKKQIESDMIQSKNILTNKG